MLKTAKEFSKTIEILSEEHTLSLIDTITWYAEKNEIEMEIYKECTRLVANCIIFYNAVLFSSLYETYSKKEDQGQLDLLRRLSPVAWQHINLIGKYEFCLNQQIINIQDLISLTLVNSEIDFSSQTPN